MCLLGERDLAKHGVPVTFFGEQTRMPAGPAKLAIDTGAALIPVHHWFTGPDTSQVSCSEPSSTSPAASRRPRRHWPTCSRRNIAAHPADWHMLQPLWEADWSQNRRRLHRGG